jgi:heme-degrading monooxygenase HmoA
MFIAVYEMIAKTGREKEFEIAWADVTEAIYRVRGSLGSRLHLSEKPRVYIAYAQWPSRQIFEDNTRSHSFTPEERAAFTRMSDAAETISTVHKLETVDDRLR